MAYSRGRRASGSRGRSSYRAAPARGRYSAARRTTARKAPARGRRASSSRQQTVRIVVEGLPASQVARRNPFESVMGAPQVEGRSPRKAKL